MSLFNFELAEFLNPFGANSGSSNQESFVGDKVVRELSWQRVNIIGLSKADLDVQMSVMTPPKEPKKLIDFTAPAKIIDESTSPTINFANPSNMAEQAVVQTSAKSEVQVQKDQAQAAYSSTAAADQARALINQIDDLEPAKIPDHLLPDNR